MAPKLYKALHSWIVVHQCSLATLQLLRQHSLIFILVIPLANLRLLCFVIALNTNRSRKHRSKLVGVTDGFVPSLFKRPLFLSLFLPSFSFAQSFVFLLSRVASSGVPSLAFLRGHSSSSALLLPPSSIYIYIGCLFNYITII